MNSDNTLSVLVVDDDATMRLLMRHTLQKAGFNVAEAVNGREAVEMFRDKVPDIILLDVMMPEMDGYSACSAMRAMSGGEHVPILMVTGLDDTESINKAYEAGATDFITKPISYPLLSHRMRYVLRANRAMQRVGQSEARLAHAQAIARLGNWCWDIGRDCLEASDEIFQIIGMPREDFGGRLEDLLAIVHPDDKETVATALQRAQSTGIPYGLEHRIQRPNGEVRIVHHLGEAKTDNTDQVIAISGIFQNITERKLAEEELEKYRHHLEELVRQRTAELLNANIELKKANEEAEQANALKDQFVSLVAHDLRSPLAGMLTALDYMYTDEEDPLNADHQEIVGRLLNIGKSLVSMIEDVLDIGKLKTGKLQPYPRIIEGREMIQEIIEKLNFLAKQKGVILANDVPAGTIFYADPALYGEVLQNLASNAIKFCYKGDRVTFYLPPDKPHTVAIKDTGIGIAPEIIPKLFRIEEKTTTPGTCGEQGTGFGLPFSHDIVAAHGGELGVESQPGQGSTFFVTLPAEVLEKTLSTDEHR